MSTINSLGNQNIGRTDDLRSARLTAGRTEENIRPTEETHTPAPELAHLLAALQRIPQVRQEVLSEIAARLAGGDLNTPEATAATVQAIMSAEMPS